MNQLRVSSALALKRFAFPRWAASILALSTLLSATAAPPHAYAITINIEYSNEGDTIPHDENPMWDPAGTFLKSHFQTAKLIWEALLPGGGSYDINFEWDDDITELGLTNPDFFDPGSYLIEMNPTKDWYADSDFAANDDFDFTQTLYPGLSAANQSAWFPGATPPAALEVGYVGTGTSTANSIQPGVTSANGFDLLTVILHEIGHVLGFSGTEPGEYNIDPQHLAGVSNVLVKEAEDDTILFESHLAGSGAAPWLMDSNTIGGQRTLPTATDVLVIAEDQGITDVRLARVGRISNGLWSDANAWIGGDVPGAAQDAYVTQGGTVSLDVNASVKSLLIHSASTVDTQGRALTSAGDLKIANGTLAVGAGGSITSAGDIELVAGTIAAGGSITSGDVNLVDGTIAVGAGGSITSRDVNIVSGSLSVASGGSISADKIDGDPATLTTAAGSTVEFNNFTRGASSTTAATFNGSVKIGVGDGEELVTFNPNAIATWNVGQNLTVGDFLHSAQLVIDNGQWNVGGALNISGGSEVLVDGGYLDNTLNLTGGKLDVTGPITIGGALTYRGRRASNTTYTLNGGTAFIKNVPPTPPFLVSTGGGMLTFENTNQGGIPVSASVDTAMINVGGGTGDGGDGAVVTFKGNSNALHAEFWNRAGIGGISLRISNPVVIAGTGGRVIFEDDSYANTSHFRNDGVAAHGPLDSGGATYFRDDSYAANATFDNYGSTLQSYTGAVPAPGGRTEFFDTAGASSGTFNNHPGQGMGSLGAGVTIFRGNSSAANGMFYNKGGVPGAQHGGSVEFYDSATAGNATFYNERAQGITQNSGSAGNVRFYGSSTAGNATFHNQRGGGSVFFNDLSTAGDGHFFIEDAGGASFYGHVVFNGNSKGGTADLTIGPNCNGATIEFYGTSNAEQAQITLMNGWQGFMRVTNSASLGQANVDVGSGSGGNLIFRESGTAANSTIRLRPGGGADFTGGGTTAANAIITLDGATVANGGVGSLNFTGANAGDATIYVNGGTATNAAGAQLGINNGSNVGTAKIIAGSGTGGGSGGRVTLDPSSTAANARFTIGAGGSLNLQGFGDAQIGSLDVAGSVFLGQTGLRVGALNTSNTISGPIGGFVGNGNAKLTKVGTGTLTLTGANTYAGLTKVDGGALAINGSTPGAVEVNNGAMLMGTGTIVGAVTVNSGGTLAPGASPGKMTIGGLNLSSGSTLAMEIGGVAAGTQYDQVISTGAFSLAGALNVSLVNGFSPSAGQSFNLFDWGTVSGSFSALSLPTLGGSLAWNTAQLYATGVLSVAAADLPGDFTGDGFVNAADLAAWQAGFGTGSTRAQGDSDGDADVDGADFLAWQRQVGAGAPAVSANVSIPEPASLSLCVVALAAIRQIGGRMRQQLIRA